jgi:hypothetical protein
LCCGNLNWFWVCIVCVFGDFSPILYISLASIFWALTFMYPILKQVCFAPLDVGLRFRISFSIFPVHFSVTNQSISVPFNNLWTFFVFIQILSFHFRVLCKIFRAQSSNILWDQWP